MVRGVLKLKAAAPFSRPVNEEEVPGYGLAVQNPMDLGTVLEKLKNGEYTSLGRVGLPALGQMWFPDMRFMLQKYMLFSCLVCRRSNFWQFA